MKKLKTLDEAALFLTQLTNGPLKIGAPLGLGKSNQLLNLVYTHFKNTPSRQLEIYTALSLDIPQPQSSLEKKLLQPFLDRHFGIDYPRLTYVKDLLAQRVPSNIQIYEFYFLAGQFLDNLSAQKNYISLNYTHAARGICNRGLQVIIQMVAKKGDSYSLSCNPDLTLDLVDMYREQKKKLFVVAVIHPDLPFLGGDAQVDESFFDLIVDSPEVQHQLFALPRAPIDRVDHMIGLHASQLVADDGTLQIGIGSLSDALVYWMLQRHQDNKNYLSLTKDYWSLREKPKVSLHFTPFNIGLYGTSEMIMDGFMYLRQGQILKRYIFDQDEQRKRFLHGAFFLGTKKLYQWLRNLNEEDFSGLSMTRVSKVNDLYDDHEMALRRQRKNARFFNTCMQIDLLGGVASDTISNGQVISGVGGQYNFVSMSQELIDSHSVLMVRSTRIKNGKRLSNIVTMNAQLTIPRHLRDIIITEYGIAVLHGKTDSEVIQALLNVCDSQFQPELLKWAKTNKKISLDYEIPEVYKNNHPRSTHSFISSYSSFFPEAPFGLDFDETEFKLIKALTQFKKYSKLTTVPLLIKNLFSTPNKHQAELERMKLWKVTSVKEFLERLIVITALNQLAISQT